jgi:DNA-binding transcriptional ArsR family regulator
MERVDHSRAYRISNRAEAAALDHPVRARLLLACALRERSLTELAQELGQPLPKLHYHLGRLTACGLLRQSRVEPRAGRPIRYYRAVAESFLISLADMGESVGEGLSRELRRSLAEEANRKELWLFYHMDEAGHFRMRMIDSEGGGRGPRVFEHWKILRLTAEQRVTMAQEIAAVIARYESPPSPGGEAFLVHAAFAPKIS